LPEATPETASGEGLRLAVDLYRAEGAGERSLPILYDRRAKRIVSNESAEIVRMMSTHAAALGGAGDLYPEAECAEIDGLNDWIYTDINDGAYKAGFSSDQAVYADAFERYFAAFARLEALLADGRPFLTGEAFTEADLRLFPTLYRHDPVYYVRMKLKGARVLDYPYLWRWLCRVHALPGVAVASNLVQCRQGYFGRSWNGVVPLGPRLPMPYPEAFNHPELAG
ncbi:MAG: glutathione S-transferase C-terminal domain-containing protein, partial [Shimia sp.]